MKIGDWVRTVHDPAFDKEYVIIAQQMRLALTGQVGQVTEESTGHGICYCVRVSKAYAYYEESELVPYTFVANEPLDRFCFE